VAPPPGEAWKTLIGCVPLVHKATGQATGAGIQVFVTAPDGKIYLVVVKL
jgi:hypothetical protein